MTGVSEVWREEKSPELIYLLLVGLPTLLEHLDNTACLEPEHSLTPAGGDFSATVSRERPARLVRR